MKPAPSPLDILDFAIMKLEFDFIQPEKNGKADPGQHFNEYNLDIDFSIHSNDIIQVFIKAAINKESKKLPGYSILAEAVCIFEFNKSIPITKDVRNNIEGYSTIYIALNALRGFISQVTANAPLGRYILPSIDLNDLIMQKKNALSAGKKSAKKKT